MDKIEIFNQIRDIPYHIRIDSEVGSDCEDKGKLLINRFSEIGIDARMRIGLFYWDVVKLPNEVMKIEHDEHCSHFFVEVKNSQGEWIFIDPTWNSELKNAGFPIAYWDGESSTALGIDCYKILSPIESEEYMKKINYDEDLQKNSKFYKAINEYCDRFI